MGWLDWIGDTVGKVWSGVKDVASNVYSGVKSATDWVAEKVQPIVKTVGDVASYIPGIGGAISGVANQINKGIDVAKGFVGKAGDIGRGIGLLNQRKYSRAMM